MLISVLFTGIDDICEHSIAAVFPCSPASALSKPVPSLVYIWASDLARDVAT
jgi:hypothetical protein